MNDSTKSYRELAPVNITGVERTGELPAQGLTEDTRCHFIRLSWRHELPNDLPFRLDLGSQRSLFVLTCGDNRSQLEMPKYLNTWDMNPRT